VGLNSLKSLNVYPNNKNNNNKGKTKPLEIYELAGKKLIYLVGPGDSDHGDAQRQNLR
jgi:hypothetical protein